MSTFNTGGPAFPNSDASAIHRIGMVAMEGIEDIDQRDLIYTNATAKAAQGMSLRDYFAAKAMAALAIQDRIGVLYICEVLGIAREDYLDTTHWPAYVAKCAYAHADAMINAREAA